MNYSQIRIETGTKGPVTIEYRYEGDRLTGWYLKTYLAGKCVSTKGTPSSGYTKKFKRLTSSMLAGFTAQSN